jgi:hypothetical protein
MKTAENIAVEILNEIREQGDEVESYYLGKLIPKIKQILLDAFKAGEKFAANIAHKKEIELCKSILHTIDDKDPMTVCQEAILTDCQNRKELPK